MYKEKSIRNFIKALAVILMLVGVSLLIFSAWRIVFEKNLPEVSMPIVYLTALAITASLLGSVFEEVMIKIGEKKYKELIPEEVINSIIEKREEEQKQEKELKLDNSNFVAIVAVGDTYNWNVQHNIYYCQSYRPIKDGVNYIAFYKAKKITKLYKVKPVSKEDVKSGGITLPITFPENDIPSVYRLTFETDLNIIHDEKGAYIQSRKYVSYDALMNARNGNTSDIANN